MQKITDDYLKLNRQSIAGINQKLNQNKENTLTIDEEMKRTYFWILNIIPPGGNA